jgi:general secretion pathway protein F
MPIFAYSARASDGRTVSAEVSAASRRDALRIIKTRGLTLLRLSEPAEAAAAKAAPTAKAVRDQVAAADTGGVRLGRKHRLPFLTQLHELTSGGLSAGEAVRLLAARVKDPAMSALYNGIWTNVSEGATLSRAFAAYPQVFDENTINLIQAGEATGNLNEVFERLIAYLTEQRELQRDLATALAYPAFLSVVAFGVVMFFLFFLLPRLEALFKSLKGELPLSTKLLIGSANFVLSWWGAGAIILVVVGVVSFWGWRKTEEGRFVTDGWLIRLPIVGPFFVSRTVLAFTQNLSVLLSNGVTTADALRMTEKQIANRVHREIFAETTGRVLEGEVLSKALARTGCFPDLVLDQLAVSESNGNLAPGLRKVAMTFQKTLTTQLNFFTKIIGSAVLLGVFAFVGFIAFAIVQAVFSMSQAIK